MSNTNPFENYWSLQEFCSAAGIGRRTADRWHQRRFGPRRTKLGRRIMYRKSDVAEWLDRQGEGGDLP